MSDASPDDEDDFIEIGRKLFAGPCEFIWAADDAARLPPMGPVEIAFAGRSNVGKSSLLNALTGRRALARTSHTPGRTQQLNFFNLGLDLTHPALRLVDMPGYGYAAVSKEKIAQWSVMMRDFLRGRATLARAFVLIDSRHGVKDVDRDIMQMMDRAALSYQVVMTKADEIKQSQQAAQIALVSEQIRKNIAAHPEIILTSSETGLGIAQLRATIARLLHDRGTDPFSATRPEASPR